MVVGLLLVPSYLWENKPQRGSDLFKLGIAQLVSYSAYEARECSLESNFNFHHVIMLLIEIKKYVCSLCILWNSFYIIKIVILMHKGFECEKL